MILVSHSIFIRDGTSQQIQAKISHANLLHLHRHAKECQCHNMLEVQLLIDK